MLCEAVGAPFLPIRWSSVWSLSVSDEEVATVDSAFWPLQFRTTVFRSIGVVCGKKTLRASFRLQGPWWQKAGAAISISVQMTQFPAQRRENTGCSKKEETS